MQKYTLSDIAQIKIEDNADGIISNIKTAEKNIAQLQDKIQELKHTLIKFSPFEIGDKVKITDDWGNVRNNLRISDIGLNNDYSFSYELYPFGEYLGKGREAKRVIASKKDIITKLSEEVK